MRLQAIIGRTDGKYIDPLGAKGRKSRSDLLHFTKWFGEMVIFNPTNYGKIIRTPNPKAQKFDIPEAHKYLEFVLYDLEDPQEFYQALSEKGYSLMDSKITPDYKLKQTQPEEKK